MKYNDIASEVLHISKKAGALIMDYYNGKISVTRKADESPVTEADYAANDFIKKSLQDLTPQIPVVSEENSEQENQSAAAGELFWMVDPLDGTKSFIKKSGEFTVNIALIKQGQPQGGVVYIPVTNTAYYTGKDGKAYKQVGDNTPEVIQVRPKPKDRIVVVASKSHMNEETEKYIKLLGDNITLISAASSLKFCMVAEGKADLYPRFGNTMEWDTAAGHAVLLAAGGHIKCADEGEFIYRKNSFLNPFFIASGG